MRRELLIEDQVKKDLGITHKGCKSSFSTIIGTEVALARERKAINAKAVEKQLEKDSILRAKYADMINAAYQSTSMTSTFVSMPPSASITYTPLQAGELDEENNQVAQSPEIEQAVEHTLEELADQRRYIQSRYLEQYQMQMQQIQYLLPQRQLPQEDNTNETTPKV